MHALKVLPAVALVSLFLSTQPSAAAGPFNDEALKRLFNGPSAADNVTIDTEAADPKKKVNIQGDQSKRTKPSLNCVVWSNLGTISPSLLNNCNVYVTVEVSAYSRSGVLVDERTFHLARAEDRVIRHVGYQMMIVDVTDFQSGRHCDDASRHLIEHTEDLGSEVTGWRVRNSAGGFVGFKYQRYVQGRFDGELWSVAPAGQSQWIAQFFRQDQPAFMQLLWSCLDPR